MKPQFDNSNSCPCCGRHCPADDLHCPRGRSYFGQEPEQSQSHHAKGGHGPGGNIKDETVILLLKCGHYLHHDLRESAENEDILSFLSTDEKNELKKLLNKCLEHWN